MTNTLDTMWLGFVWAFRFWWVWMPIILGAGAYTLWFDYQRKKHLLGRTWVMLEITPPQEILYSSPRAAENFFAGLHSAASGGTAWKSQFFEGKVPDWFSFEIVSNGGETRFLIRCPSASRNLIEAALFAQYPNCEMRVIDDYIEQYPETLDLSTHDIMSAELEMTKDFAYPIKTYLEFEEGGGKDEYARLDPLAPLVETMSALMPGESLWLQYVVRATGGDWVKEGQKVVDKLTGKAEKDPEKPLVEQIILFPLTILEAILVSTGIITPVEEKKKEDKPFTTGALTPSQKFILEHVEEKLAKLGFKVTIRLTYLARKEVFNMGRFSGVTAMFKQLYFNNLNSFKPVMSKDKGIAPWLFPDDKGFGAGAKTVEKKQKMYKAYRERAFKKKDNKEHLIYLNTEELATLWHLPGLNVRAPLLPRVQAKKGQPPSILPMRP